MKAFLSTFMILSSVFILNAQENPLGNTDPQIFTKFKVPETTLKGIKLNFGASYDGNNSTSTSSYLNSDDLENYNKSENNYQINFNPSGFYLNENDETNLLFNWSLQGNYSHSHSEFNVKAINSKSNYDGRTFNISPNYFVSYKNYFDSMYPLFGKVEHSLGYNYQDSFKENTSNFAFTESKNSSSNIQRSLSSINSFSIGFGKIRNVTSVVSAIRFQERLKKTNVTDQDLSEETILKLSEQISRNQYYSSVYDRGGKYFWNDVDPILENEIRNLNTMNTFSKLYAFEIFNEIRFIRKQGYTINLGLNSAYFQNSNSESAEPGIYNEFQGETHTINLFLSGEFSQQLNLNSQFRAGFYAGGGPQLSKLNSSLQQYRIIANAGIDYELTDKLVNSFTGSYEFFKYNNVNPLSFYSHEFRLFNNSQYFIEDNLSLNLNAELTWKKYANKEPELLLPRTELKTDSSTQRFSLGLTYYFDRAFIGNFVNSNPLN